MEVYWEYAFAENFLLDLLLLYLALKIARGNIGVFRLMLAAGVGAAEAICFPLLPLPVWAAYAVKLLGGILIAVLSVKRGTPKTYLVVTVGFFALTFALGGLLTAIYSFFRISYSEESGYLVESAPVGLVIGGAGVFFLIVSFAAKKMYQYRRMKRSLFPVRLEHGGKTVQTQALADTGNGLSYRGKPVNVLSPAAALALFRGEASPEGRMLVQTVNGERESPVFPCDRMIVEKREFRNVLFTVGDVASREYQIILHTFFVEENHETFGNAADLVAEDKR